MRFFAHLKKFERMARERGVREGPPPAGSASVSRTGTPKPAEGGRRVRSEEKGALLPFARGIF